MATSISRPTENAMDQDAACRIDRVTVAKRQVGFHFQYSAFAVLLSTVSVCFMGCAGTLEQQSQTVRVSPVSDDYKFDGNLNGRTYILLAETSTGQEQHRYAVSDSLAMALKEGTSPLPADPNSEKDKRLVNLSFLGFNGADFDPTKLSCDEIEIMSFTDLTNKLNEKDLVFRHAEMKKFYQQNGMFKKSDLEFLANEIGADYIILPCLLDISRWSKGRFSVVGVRFLQTQVVSGMLGLEIWDTRTGRKVFSATSDITLASEKVREEPISMEEAFRRAWHGIMREFPNQSPPRGVRPINTVRVEEDSDRQQQDDADAAQPALAGGEVARAEGDTRLISQVD